ncbi:MAG: hypothetical protein ABIR57_11000 [Aeromicrobium sp.]
MTEPTAEAAHPSIPSQRDLVWAFAAYGLLLALISAVVVSIARSMSPVVLEVQDVEGVDQLYGTGGAEYFWIAVGAVIGLAAVAMIAVAAIAKGIQLGRR